MATIGQDENGRRRILFVGSDGKRRTLRLGKTTQKAAEAVKLKVERLNGAAITGQPVDDETARWLSKLDSKLLDKLAAVGLIVKREVAALGEFIDSYLAGRSDVKRSTQLVLGHVRRCLVDYFGAKKLLRDITPGDAEDWRRWLKSSQKLSEATIRRRSGIAKQFFRYAVKKRLLAENPFSELKAGNQANDDRDYFLSREDAAKIIAACPDAQWRLIFALSRFGGLRCPSEHVNLKWGDVDWSKERMTVRSPKTEHHEGCESREVPIFPELRPYLEECLNLAEDKEGFVITRYRAAEQNLRTTFQKVIKRAGLTAWPKLFANLRSSRATELAKEFPGYVAAAWMGHSALVAQKHYWQVTDSDFSAATKSGTESGTVSRQDGAQNQAQQAAAKESNRGQKSRKHRENNAIIADACRCSPSAAAEISRPAGTRTQNQQIMSLLL
jgi:integrase